MGARLPVNFVATIFSSTICALSCVTRQPQDAWFTRQPHDSLIVPAPDADGAAEIMVKAFVARFPGTKNCEVRYAQIHAQIIYALRGIPLVDDAYETGEFPREFGKRAFNIAVNVTSAPPWPLWPAS
jgi:hypothetical protein